MGGKLLDEYRRDVERIFGVDLVSLTVYGSRADEEPAPGAEAAVLIVVRELSRAALEGYRDVAHRYARRRLTWKDGIAHQPNIGNDSGRALRDEERLLSKTFYHSHRLPCEPFKGHRYTRKAKANRLS